MKKLLVFLFAVSLMGCTQQAGTNAFDSAEERAERARQDSIVLADSLASIYASQYKINGSTGKESFMDTTGIYLAPVKVTRAVFFREEYSSFYSVRLNYKNVSGKDIQAIRFEWYGENAFSEPADMGSGSDGHGRGFSDDLLRSGSSTSGAWSILSRDGKKIIGARAYEVAFADGTKWARE